MVKKSIKSLNILDELQEVLKLDNSDYSNQLVLFLDKLCKEGLADYACILGLKPLGEILSSNCPESIRDVKYSNLKCFDIDENIQLCLKPSEQYKDEFFDDYFIASLKIIFSDINFKERTTLITSLTSEVRKTLRPDLALGKIFDALGPFLDLKEFYFFKKIGELEDDETFELIVNKRADDSNETKLARIFKLSEIKDFSYISDKDNVEVFYSRLRDKLWGIMVLAKRGPWTSLDKDLVQPFSEQMATVLNQHELHAESLSMAQREFLLNQLTTTIRESLDVDEIIKIACQEIAQVMGVEACGISIVNRKMRSKLPHYSWAVDEDLNKPMLSVLSSVINSEYMPNTTQTTISVSDFDKEESPKAKFIIKNSGVKSYLTCALYKANSAEYSDEILGIVSVAFFNHRRTWSEDEERLLESIAAQLEMALTQAAIYQESQQTKMQMALLHKLSTDIRESLEISKVLEQIAKGLGEILGLSRCFVRKMSPDYKISKTEKEYIAPGFNPCADIIFDFEKEWINTLAKGKARKKGTQFLHIPDVHSKLEETGSILLPLAEAIELKSYLCVPLVSRDRILGTINVHQCDRLRTFLDEEIEFICRVASEAVVAIEHAELFETIDKMNKTDPDTGLYNKRYFRSISAEEIKNSEIKGKEVSMIVLDLDHLKEINDTPGKGGHYAGDEAIQIVAKVLEKTVRQTPVDEVRRRVADIVARFGGDEFMILLPDTGLKEAVVVAERILDNIRKAKHSTWDKPLTASIGVAGTPDDPYDFNILIAKADKALYLSKEKGRNSVSSSLEIAS